MEILGTWGPACQDLSGLQVSHLWNGRTYICLTYVEGSSRNQWENTWKSVNHYTNIGVLLLVLPGSLLSSVHGSESLKIQVAKDSKNHPNLQLFMSWLFAYKFCPCSSTDPKFPQFPNAKWWSRQLSSDDIWLQSKMENRSKSTKNVRSVEETKNCFIHNSIAKIRIWQS